MYMFSCCYYGDIWCDSIGQCINEGISVMVVCVLDKIKQYKISGKYEQIYLLRDGFNILYYNILIYCCLILFS